MSRILRFFAFVFGVFCVGNVLAAGYSCPTYKQYTSCAVGYYMTSNASSTTYNGTPAVGNACRPCSVMGQYNNIDKYTCPGGTAAPVKKTVKVTYVLNGGSGTTPAATACNFGEACSLNPGTGTSYHRAGYRLVGWSTASSATSGAFSMVLTAKTTVYAVWTRCAEGTYKTASATPASACATMSYGYHGTGCDSSYMACTGQAQCTGTTFCEQHIKQECPDPNSEENRREIFPEEYSGSQMVGGKVISANGRGAITECMALVWYDPDPNVTDGQTVGLHEYVFVDRDTKRYQGEVSSWLYDAVGPGYYLTDESGCDEGYASYKSVDICPVGAACPGKEKVECDSSNEATVLTETFGLEICTDGNTTSSTGSIKCDSACSNVIGAATWTTPTWSPSTRQVLDKCAINTCSTGYTRSGSASSTAPASYTCSANCNKVTLNGIKNGGSGTTTLYKKTGLATWYSDNACSDVVTKLSPLPTKPNASYAGHYNTSAASGGTQCVAANGTFKTAAACNVSGNTTFYAQYKCDSNYLGSGTRIAGACTGTVRTIYLKSYDGSATHSTIYQKYATGWYSNSAATNEISKADIPSRDGYTFRGFYTSKQTDLTASGGTGTRRITANGTLPVNTTFTSNANLFAAWAHNCIQPSNGTCTLTISDTGTVTYATTCKAGYYISGAGTYNPTCTPCGDGTYSAGGTATSCTTCPGEYTHSDGTRAASGNCYLTTVAGKYVATANANQITCDNTTAYYYPGGTKVYYGGTGGNVPLIKGEWNAVNTGGTCASKAYCPAGTWGSVAGTCDSIPAGSYPGAASGCATKDDAGDYIGCSGYEACSSLSGVSVSGGTYTSAAGSKNSKACKYTAPSKTITGCSTVTTNTVTYTGTAWPATTYGVTATGGYIISGNNTAAATCTQCSGAVWSAGGTATSCSACPAQTSGWTRNSGTGWTAVTQCNQTKSVGGNCSAGVLKQNATSTTVWGETTISTALQAKPGYIVSGQTCTGCAAGTYSAGGTATSCSACTGRTHYSAAHSASCSTVSTGYYTTGCNTSNNNCTGQSQCTSGTWCSSGVQHQCSGLTGVSVSGGTYTSAAGSSANTSCKYTAPNKTITGCSTVTTNTVTYTGTAWPATTYGVTATGGYVISGNNTAAATCTQCSGAVWSAGGTATSCSACPAQTSGWTRNSGTGWAAVTQCNQTKTGTAISSYCASGVLKQNATSATAWGATTISTALSAKAGSIVNGQTCEQCSGAVWSAGGTATSCSACPAQTSGWTRNSGTGWAAVTQCNQTKTGTAISSYCASGVLKQNATSATAWGATTISTALSAKAGSIVNGQTCEQCSGAVWSAGGTATSCSACPAQTSGWTRNSGTGWTAVTQCNQTKSVGGNCSAGVLKQNATSTTAWGETTISTVLQAKPGYIVSGQTCTGCAAGTYSAGGAATSCSACTGRTQYSAAHASSCSTVSTGYYTTGCNTSNNNCTGQSQCTSGTWCSSGVQHQCSGLTGVSVSGGTYTSAAGSSANTSCKYTAPNKTITGCSTVTTNTVTYTGTAWPATTYGVTATGGYVISGNNTAAATCTQCGTAKYSAGGTATSCSACPAADSGWTATSPAGSSAYTACYEYQTPVNCASGTVKRAASSATAYSSTISLLSTLKSKAGYYASTTATSCTICPAGSSCAASATAPTTCVNWTYAASAGMASCTACPVLTSGWTKANSTGTGWSSHTNCVQISPTPAGCASGNNKQVAASNGATTWGPATVNTELSAKAGHIVSGTTCPICTGATYSAGGTATSCTTCPSIYTSDNTNGKTKNSECKVTTNAGKYIATAGDNTQTICPVKHYCPSASVAYGATNSPTACPPADSTTERTTYPADYLNPTRTSFSLQGWGNGLGAITSCMAYYSFTNSAGRFNVESVHYNSTTGKYDVGGGKYYTAANPGWYMVDKYGSTYCNTSTHPMYYHNVAECPANSYCPGYSSMPLCSTGTYEDEMGKFACSSLGTGAYTKSPAKSGPATACYLTTTATNFVKTAKAAEEKCTAGGYCAGGTKVNWGSTGGRTPASAGYYVSGTGATSQTACAAGTYTDTTGKTTCTSAVAGTHTTGCQVAASGSSTKTLACTGTAVCATNTYSSAKASACTACATAKGYTNSGTTAAAHAELASCKATCSGGQYVATAGAGCVNVGTGYYGAGGTVGQNATLARNQCPTGQTTIGYGAGADEIGDCGRILHIGDNKVYLRNTKKTTPSLNVKVGDTTYYGNMTSGTSKGKLRVKNGTTTYSVHDDSM